jgi:hypothetical protein
MCFKMEVGFADSPVMDLLKEDFDGCLECCYFYIRTRAVVRGLAMVKSRFYLL